MNIDGRKKLGIELDAPERRQVLAAYVHRYTGDHRPAWAQVPWKDGRPYPLQFSTDADWLAHTYFRTTRTGRLDTRAADCYSTPTWPNNPELRSPS